VTAQWHSGSGLGTGWGTESGTALTCLGKGLLAIYITQNRAGSPLPDRAIKIGAVLLYMIRFSRVRAVRVPGGGYCKAF